MNLMPILKSFLCLAMLLLIPWSGSSETGPGDAYVQFHLGLAAEQQGDITSALQLYKQACMAEDGLARACLKWAELARGEERQKDRKRALSSAVMLSPGQVEARYLLAMHLLEKGDYTWAIEHLSAALETATLKSNRAVIRYYLGYALYKNGELDQARHNMEKVRFRLPAPLAQRCLYYLGLIALAEGRRQEGTSLLRHATTGPSEKWARSAEDRIFAESAFTERHWYSGQASISLGVNTHPSSAFLDDPSAKSSPVLQSVFRGDLLLNAGNYRDALNSSITFYREQNWQELGNQNQDDKADPFSPQDLNTTLFLGQLGYLRRAWLFGVEHEILLGAEGQVQMLDHVPVKTGNAETPIVPSDDAFQVYGWATALKLWWTVAESKDALYSGRLKFENWSNEVETDRTALRLRVRFAHTRYFQDRKFRLVALVGFRYDRTYHDPYVIKYDRLLPEIQLTTRWRTPLPRLTVEIEAAAKYNWYLNSRLNQENSFRPAAQLTEAQLTKYYDLTRHDVEWELSGNLRVDLWKRAAARVSYVHHQRISNLDGAWKPAAVEATEYGYTRDVVLLELIQGF